MRIVVTGALGHIGSRLIRELPEAFPGSTIVLLDDFSTQRYCSLFNLPTEGRYEFHEVDILKADLSALFSGADVVVHLAAITNAAGSFEIKDRVEQVNFEGSRRVAKACLGANCAMIFLSTTSVYGSQSEVVDEDCAIDDLKPQSPYADSKLKAEDLLKELGASRGLRFVICRLGTIFGTSPGMRFHTAVNKFCWQAVLGQPITVWRTALLQNRPYLDLRDATRAIAFIIGKKVYDRSVYNVVSFNAPLRGIIDSIARYVPDLTIEYVDTAIMNQLSYHVSSKRFQALEFEFTGDLDRGIRDTFSLLKGLRP
jgi:UDP-glucose 4-epimerase